MWPLDTYSSNFADASGNGFNATRTASTTLDRPIVAKGVAAQKLGTSTEIDYPVTNIMYSGREYCPFTLEIWVKEIVSTGVTQLFQRNNCSLSIAGKSVVFTVVMNSTTVTARWDGAEVGEVYHIAATYDTQNIVLYINAVPVDTAQIESDMIPAGFSTEVGANLKTATNGSAQIIICQPAVYNVSLSQADISNHYLWGTDYPDILAISTANSAITYEFEDKFTANLTYKMDWTAGTFSGFVGTDGINIYNLFDESAGTYGAGTWKTAIPFVSDASQFVGSIMRWHGDYADADFVVEVSTDDTTFTPVLNNAEPFQNLDVSDDLNISIKLTFDETASQTFIEEMGLVLYRTKQVIGSNELANGVPFLTSSVSFSEPRPPLEFSQNGLLTTGSAGGFAIGYDPIYGSYSSAEMLVYVPAVVNSTTIFSIGSSIARINSSGQFVHAGMAAVYVNGASASSPFTLVPGTWNHLVLVFSSAVAGAAYLGNVAAGNAGLTMRVGFLALYGRALTASQVLGIYNSLVGIVSSRTTDTALSVFDHNYAENGQPAIGYAYNWAISGSG